MADSHATPTDGCTLDALAEKAYGLLTPDTSPSTWAWTHPGIPNGQLPERELDIHDWGLMFGLTFAIARGEDPYESVESVGARAMRSAEAAFREWHGGDLDLTPRRADN